MVQKHPPQNYYSMYCIIINYNYSYIIPGGDVSSTLNDDGMLMKSVE